jgi:hypothetical protein
MERAQMNKILGEQSFQNSGVCNQSECAVEIGRVIGLDQMVVGSVGKLGNAWSLTLRLVSIESGEVLASARDARVGEISLLLRESVPRLSAQLLSGMPKSASSQVHSDWEQVRQLASDRAFLTPEGLAQMQAANQNLPQVDRVLFYKDFKVSPAYAWANALALPVGSALQQDWPGVTYIALAWAGATYVSSNTLNSSLDTSYISSDAGTSVVAKKVYSLSNLGRLSIMTAYLFDICRPIWFSQQHNKKLRDGLGIVKVAYIPSATPLFLADGASGVALHWRF